MKLTWRAGWCCCLQYRPPLFAPTLLRCCARPCCPAGTAGHAAAERSGAHLWAQGAAVAGGVFHQVRNVAACLWHAAWSGIGWCTRQLLMRAAHASKLQHTLSGCCASVPEVDVQPATLSQSLCLPTLNQSPRVSLNLLQGGRRAPHHACDRHRVCSGPCQSAAAHQGGRKRHADGELRCFWAAAVC